MVTFVDYFDCYHRSHNIYKVQNYGILSKGQNVTAKTCLVSLFLATFALMKDSAIIVSGGLDPITLLYDRRDDIAQAISSDYGQNHGAREIPFARLHCERLGIPHITIPLAFMQQYDM